MKGIAPHVGLLQKECKTQLVPDRYESTEIFVSKIQFPWQDLNQRKILKNPKQTEKN